LRVTYRCSVEQQRSPRGGSWWWFGVSGDTQRYAPFQPAPGDTKHSIRARITAYYSDLLARRALPPAARHNGKWQSGNPAARAQASQPAAAPVGGVESEVPPTEGEHHSDGSA
jgi:hypothetical protein